jgi:hypothetical protein
MTHDLAVAHKKMKIEIAIMPAWIAGIQARKEASGNVHVNLDSSTPCWNDAIEGALLKLTEAPPPRIFKRRRDWCAKP